MKELNFKGRKIRYHVQGEGETVLLLHGYLESLEIWNGFAGELAKSFRIVRMDLPGHGKSELVDDIHSMELMAKAAKNVLDAEKVDKVTIIGHSLGGYVSLAFLDQYPERVRRLSLFHSHPFADSEQVIDKRNEQIGQVKIGDKSTVFNTTVLKLFADKNLETMEDKVEWVRGIVHQTPEEGIVANLRGMMERPDRSGLVEGTDKPLLLIAGKHDKFIDYETVIPKITLPESGELVTLEDSGHLGFIEEQQRALEVIYDFMKDS